MTKQELIRQITARTEGDPLTNRLIIESFFELVKSALTEGESIYIRKFGSFTIKQRASKKARNISQNTLIELAAYTIPYFKPSSEFSDQIRAQPMPTKSKKAAK